MWIDQLTLIYEKRMVAVCHGQVFRQNDSCFSQESKTQNFEIGQLLLNRIFPHQDEYKGKFTELTRTLSG